MHDYTIRDAALRHLRNMSSADAVSFDGPTPGRVPPLARLWSLALFPVGLTTIYFGLVVLPATRAFAIRMIGENYPVDLLTFFVFLLAGAQGISLARKLSAVPNVPALPRIFYVLFAVLLLLIGMEEISWGQSFLHFETPQSISQINTQQEFNVHNLRGMGGHTEYLRIAFGVGGLVGIALARWPRFSLIGVRPILGSWFLVIAFFAAADQYYDLQGGNNTIGLAMDVMSEVIELLCAMSASAYLWLNTRRLAPSRMRP